MVCIIADGRKVVHPRVLDVLTALGLYQDGGQMKNSVNGKNVTAHLFEYTTSFALDPDLHFKFPDKGIVPTQMIFCLKEKNQRKINSHRWFFNAFAPMLQVSLVSFHKKQTKSVDSICSPTSVFSWMLEPDLGTRVCTIFGKYLIETRMLAAPAVKLPHIKELNGPVS